MSDTMSLAEGNFEDIYVEDEVRKSTPSRWESKLYRFASDRFDRLKVEHDPRVRYRYEKELLRLRKYIVHLQKERLRRARVEARDRFRGMLPKQKLWLAQVYMSRGKQMDAADKFISEMGDMADRRGAEMDDVDRTVERIQHRETDEEVRKKLEAKELPVEYDMSGSDYAKKREKERSGREASRGKGRERNLSDDDN